MKPFTAKAARIVVGVLLLALPTSARPDDVITFNGDTYAALAYSTTTGKYGYSYGQGSRGKAEAVALAGCKADDAKVVTWVHNGFCALAVGDDGAYGVGWSFGDGATNTFAKKTALEECKKRGKNARLLICACSVDRKPEIFEK